MLGSPKIVIPRQKPRNPDVFSFLPFLFILLPLLVGIFYGTKIDIAFADKGPSSGPADALGSQSKLTDYKLHIPVGATTEITKADFVSGRSIPVYISVLYRWLVGFTLILGVIALMLGGVVWIVAGGNKGTVDKAKGIIKNSLVGIFLALGSYLFLWTMSPNLVQFRPIIAKPVEEIAAKLESNPPLKIPITPSASESASIEVEHAEKKGSKQPLSTREIAEEEKGSCCWTNYTYKKPALSFGWKEFLPNIKTSLTKKQCREIEKKPEADELWAKIFCPYDPKTGKGYTKNDCGTFNGSIEYWDGFYKLCGDPGITNYEFIKN